MSEGGKRIWTGISPVVKETKTTVGVRDLDLVEQIKKYLPETAPDD